jgi:hypothetical protein
MRNKPYSTSILHGLPAEQQERVNTWLFEENVSYSELVHRCRQLLNVKVSETSARRYYARECVARRLEAVAAPRSERKQLAAGLGRRAEEEFSIAVGMASQLAADEAIKPENHGDLKRLNEAMRMTIAARRENNERRRVELHARRVALAEKRFQFNAAIECFEHQEELMKVMEKKGVSDAHKVMEIRERLFGPNLPE